MKFFVVISIYMIGYMIGYNIGSSTNKNNIKEKVKDLSIAIFVGSLWYVLIFKKLINIKEGITW